LIASLLGVHARRRVAQAKQAMEAAHAEPESEQGKVILRQVPLISSIRTTCG